MGQDWKGPGRPKGMQAPGVLREPGEPNTTRQQALLGQQVAGL